jgi:hypothetical protein
MRQPSSTVRRGRLFPENRLSPEEKAKIKAENEIFHQRCRAIFNQVQPNLIQEYYNWFIIIEPESGEYFIHIDKDEAISQFRSQHPQKKGLLMQINETGTCGRI